MSTIPMPAHPRAWMIGRFQNALVCRICWLNTLSRRASTVRSLGAVSGESAGMPKGRIPISAGLLRMNGKTNSMIPVPTMPTEMKVVCHPIDSKR